MTKKAPPDTERGLVFYSFPDFAAGECCLNRTFYIYLFNMSARGLHRRHVADLLNFINNFIVMNSIPFYR